MGILKMLFGSSKNNGPLQNAIFDGAYLVDVREPSEVAAGGVKNAVNIPLGSVEQNLNKFADKKHIIVFCRSGNRSSEAKNILNRNGFTNVINGGTWTNMKGLLSNIQE